MKGAAGFTLIELIIVIVILGFLAATALPRFLNQTTSSRIASLNMLVGNVNSASTIVQSQYQLQASSTATSIMVNGNSIDVVAGTGIPTLSGIENALSVLSGFSYNNGNGQFDFSPLSVSNCFATYSVSTGMATATTSGC